VAGQIIVSGGAGYWCGPDGLKLDEYVLSLVNRTRPRVCVVCTASGDSKEHIQGFYDTFGRRCAVTHLSLFNEPYTDPGRLLVEQDVVYVGGGSTANLLAIWRLHGVDRALRRAASSGTILCGSSAGGICWFESGITDSLSYDDTLLPMRNGLGFIAGSHAPHFDEPGRSRIYSSMVGNRELANGIGVDDYAAAHFVDGELSCVVAARPGAGAYLVTAQDGGTATVHAIPTAPI
jgi:peptidase E